MQEEGNIKDTKELRNFNRNSYEKSDIENCRYRDIVKMVDIVFHGLLGLTLPLCTWISSLRIHYCFYLVLALCSCCAAPLH